MSEVVMARAPGFGTEALNPVGLALKNWAWG